MSNKFLLSFLVLSGLFTTETAVIAKEKKAEFKYKLKSGDVSREFMSDLVGNTKSYLYDLARNFKKHPEVIATALAAAVPYALYKDEVHGYVKNFIYGVIDKNGKVVSPDHKKELAAVWVALAAVTYICKDEINKKFFADDEEIVEEVVLAKDAE